MTTRARPTHQYPTVILVRRKLDDVGDCGWLGNVGYARYKWASLSNFGVFALIRLSVLIISCTLTQPKARDKLNSSYWWVWSKFIISSEVIRLWETARRAGGQKIIHTLSELWGHFQVWELRVEAAIRPRFAFGQLFIIIMTIREPTYIPVNTNNRKSAQCKIIVFTLITLSSNKAN